MKLKDPQLTSVLDRKPLSLRKAGSEFVVTLRTPDYC